MTDSTSGNEARHLRVRNVWAIIVALLLISGSVALAACGGDDDDGGGETAAEETTAGEETADASDFRAVALFSGTANDGTFSQAIWEGMQTAEQELGVQIENAGPVESPDEMIRQAGAFAQDGADLVFIIHGALVETVPVLAERFPETQFCGILEEDPVKLAEQPENVCYFDPEQAFGSFMGGAAAGLITETDHVGAVAAIDFPILTRQTEGFQLGARCVNPDVEYSEAFTGDFNDPALARTAAESLYADGADVLLGAVDAAVQGMFTAAEAGTDPKRWVIPQYFDNYDQAPEVVLTSVEFGLQDMSRDMITDAANGELQQQYLFTDKWSLADFREHADALGEDGVAQLEELTAAVMAGEIEVPDEKGIGMRGDAEKLDPADLGC